MTTDDLSSRTSVRPSWDELPLPVRDSVQAVLGSPVANARTQTGGFSPGLAVRATLADGRAVFLKGAATDHPVHSMYADEAAINRSLRRQAPVVPVVPVPRMIDSWEAGGWLLMAFEDIAGGHPDLRPGSADLPAVMRLLDQLPKTVSPSPIPDAPTVAAVLGGGFHGWQALADQLADLDPWSARHLEQLAAVERDWLGESGGDCLLHVDLRADNMLMRDGDALAVDWAHLHQGAAWLDPAFLVPQLIRAGHTPAQAEALIADLPAWADAPPAAITSFAAAQAGYWERSSRLPAPTGVPYLRGYQADMAAIGRTWTEYRTGWW
ncbi:aminoglycoside phosphotransferase (APT) family kinase protein [Kitasatospora sp. MAA4]|uniref:phosphotransferase n=1 Tax=Kitasatospora sp. MAA4 TaxID=3035093 RepID=UPI002476E8F2|nr:phosphotransferase [Kitasatospora sp. MAA4]MDH6137364.1 aminoglycoside phosphotransferase (APT) family kinase protein [Kitasatospora sp. MAA4]